VRFTITLLSIFYRLNSSTFHQLGTFSVIFGRAPYPRTFSAMTLAVLATPECPHARDIRCSLNPSALSVPRIPRRLASPHSSRRVVAPLMDPLPSRVTLTCVSSPATLSSLNSNNASAPTPPPATFPSHHSSELHIPVAVVAQGVRTPPLPRKESCEPLKSSLKVKRPHTQGSRTLITDPINSSSSRSASGPTTPAHKGVHFHPQLEHVKLFFPKQKPLAVSRDGNPTDTSGTDSEFPPFRISLDDDLKERPFVMHRINVPTAPPPAEDVRDVAAENIDLVGTTLQGTVRVRNIAFEKLVAVRFTLDKWQTTSEVTARYKESFQNGTFDRFTFSIKLADVLSRAEEKTLDLSVRYSVSGREIWDNNSGRNYQVRVVRQKAPKADKETVVEGHESSSRPDDITDLRLKLEELSKLGCPSKTISGILAQESRRRCESFYDFATSSRTPWRPPAAHQAPAPARTLAPLRGRTRCRSRTLRHCTPPAVPTATAAQAEVSSLFPDCDSDDPIIPVPSLPSCSGSCSGSRNHTRGGSMVLSHAPGVKRTSLTLPSAPTPALHETKPFDSFPPHSSPMRPPQTPDSCENSEGTPSMTNSSSCRFPSRSPTLIPSTGVAHVAYIR
jgi:carbohydrate/starch-binding protein with CBM21 domain